MPTTRGGLGFQGGLGLLGLAGPQVKDGKAWNALPRQPSLPGAFIVHLYTNAMVFKRSLGEGQAVASAVSRPGLKQTVNGGHHPVTIELSSDPLQAPGATVQEGDIIRLTEQGDNSGTILFTGIVEELIDDIDGNGPSKHQLTLMPLVAELADCGFNRQYASLVDLTTMIRDAVAKTTHIRVSPESCSAATGVGIKAIYSFNTTNALDVLNVCKQIAGPNWYWHVDAQGLLWFLPAAMTNPPTLTLKRGQDYTQRRRLRSIRALKNHVDVLGGFRAGSNLPLTATYDNPSSRTSYGRRDFDPPLVYPTVVDQNTLNALANAIAMFDRVAVTYELTLPAYAGRLTIGRPGGLLIRVWEPWRDPYQLPRPPLVTNPGFEAADPADATMAQYWQRIISGSGTAALDAANPRSGTKAMALSSDGTTSNWGAVFGRVGIPLKPGGGGALQFSAWVKASAPGVPFVMRVSFANPGPNITAQGIASQDPSIQSGATFTDFATAAATAGYQLFTTLVPIPAGYLWAFVHCYTYGSGAAGTIYVDDVELIPGGYDGPFVALDVVWENGVQKLIVSNVPLTGLNDIRYLLDRIVQRFASYQRVIGVF